MTGEPLSAIFDGELHWMEPDEHFISEGSSAVLVGFEKIEDDNLSPLEAPLEPLFEDKPALYKHNNKPAEADLLSSWGNLSINLSAFAKVCGFEKKQYQHATQGQPSAFSFQTNEHITERM